MSSNSVDIDEAVRQGERLKDLLPSKPTKSDKEMEEIVGEIGCVLY